MKKVTIFIASAVTLMVSYFCCAKIDVTKRGNVVKLANNTGKPITLDKNLMNRIHRQQGRVVPKRHNLPKNRNQHKKKNVKPVGGPQFVTLKGAMRIDGKHNELPEFRIYFDGMETMSNTDGFFTFPLDTKDLQSCSIIMCKHMFTRFERKNTVKDVRVLRGKKYKRFSLVKTGTDNQWAWQQEELKGDKYIVPEKSIYVFIDPDFVDHLEPWSLTLTDSFVTLPRIVLRSGFDKQLKRNSAKSLLYSLDSKVFHETVSERRKVLGKGKGVMSIIG